MNRKVESKASKSLNLQTAIFIWVLLTTICICQFSTSFVLIGWATYDNFWTCSLFGAMSAGALGVWLKNWVKLGAAVVVEGLTLGFALSGIPVMDYNLPILTYLAIANAIAYILVGHQLVQFFNKNNSFIILLAVSFLGLGLGGLAKISCHALNLPIN